MKNVSQRPQGRRQEFAARVYEIVRAIPCGKVMSYGMIGALIPPPPGMDGGAYERVRARWVGYAMSDCPDDVPWHRVVNAAGGVSARPGYGGLEQRALLEQEGVLFNERGLLCLEDHRWLPSARWLAKRGLLDNRA
jgi:methylated-DNA-protein-cysteine methyltransferase-like protein